MIGKPKISVKNRRYWIISSYFIYLDKHYFLVHLSISFSNYEFWYVSESKEHKVFFAVTLFWGSYTKHMKLSFQCLWGRISELNITKLFKYSAQTRSCTLWSSFTIFKKKNFLEFLTSFQITCLENKKKIFFYISLNQVLYTITTQKSHFLVLSVLLVIFYIRHSQLTHR